MVAYKELKTAKYLRLSCVVYAKVDNYRVRADKSTVSTVDKVQLLAG